MDPALSQLIAEGAPEEEVAVLLRLADPTAAPPEVRLIAQFGNIATCRVNRADILTIHAAPTVRSVKAARYYAPAIDDEDEGDDSAAMEEALSLIAVESDIRRPQVPGLPTGKGVVIGHIDWGIDFVHPEFRLPDGSTRLLALWDQRGAAYPDRPNRYGYGRIFSREDINRALLAEDPYEALDYNPADFDTSRGSHGTHTMSISAGNDRAGGPTGIAPEADLCFVHFAPFSASGPVGLGDSVTYVEGIDMILRTATHSLASDHPGVAGPGMPPVTIGSATSTPPGVVINSSLGRQAGHHVGTSLVEQALDAALRESPGRAFIHSTGNYFNRNAHACGTLRPGETESLQLRLNIRQGRKVAGPDGPVEVEIWYPGTDRFTVSVVAPDGTKVEHVHGDEDRVFTLRASDDTPVEIGRLYHRLTDPNNGDNEIMLYLFREAPAGEYQVILYGEDIADGRYHAWIERNEAGRRANAQFRSDDVDPTYTTGTICNGFRTIAVGAYDAHAWRRSGDVPGTGRPLTAFSSSGPTRDGRQKPECCAPGYQVLAARSHPRTWPGMDEGVPAPLHSRMSGTSMAAPHVTGTVALMFEAAGRPLPIEETRRLLLASTDPAPESASETARWRIGDGFLNTVAAVEAAAATAVQRPLPEAEDALPASIEARALVAIPSSLEDSPMMTPSPDAEEFLAAESTTDESEPEGYYPEYYPEYYEDEEDISEKEEKRSSVRSSRSRRDNDLPFSFVLPLGGGGIAPALTVPVGGSGSPFAFALPLTGSPAPSTTSTAPVAGIPVMPVMPVSGTSGVSPDPSWDTPIVVAEPSITESAGMPAAGGNKSALFGEDLHAYESSEFSDDGHAEWGERIVSVADTSASDPRALTSRSSTMLSSLLGAVGLGQGLSPLGNDTRHVPSATELFNAFVLAGNGSGPRQRLQSHYARHLRPVALPGRRLDGIDLRAGDILVRVARGEQWGQFSVIAEPRLLDHLEAGGHQPGGYVRVIEWGPVPRRRQDRFARRLTGAAGKILPDTLVLRIRPVYGEMDESDTPSTTEKEARPPSLARGASGAAVRELQAALNRVSLKETGAGRPPLDDAPLKEDGKFGPETENAVRDFQIRQFPDDASQWTGVVGPDTWQKLDAASGKETTSGSGVSAPTRENAEYAGAESDWSESNTHTADLSDSFFVAMRATAATLGTDPEFLLGVMNSESGIRASAHNPNGHASGLIQFMPATLIRLGWTQGHEAFRQLSADEQMPFVLRYYLPFVPKGLNSTARLYQATFLPATLSRGSDPDTVLVDVNRNDNAFAYGPNSGLDRRKDGRILVGDLTAFVERAKKSARWQEALDRLRAAVPGPVPPAPIPPGPAPVPPTPVPPQPSPAAAHPVLRRGAQGDAVREAQTKLNLVHARAIATGGSGVQDAPLMVDGAFGVHTYNAVVSFQQQVFPASPPDWDGVVGPKTWAQLDALSGVSQGVAAPVESYDLDAIDEAFDLGEQAGAAINWCQMRQTIAATARAEEARWTRPNGSKIRENDPAMLPVLTSYWATVPGFQTPAQALNEARRSARDVSAWSAAFICFVMHTAGVQQAHGFEFSQRHLSYIVGALRNRERSDQNRVFWLTDQTELEHEANPQPGDLLCFNRCCEQPGAAAANGCPAGFAMTRHSYVSLRRDFWGSAANLARPVRGCSHTAIVVGTTRRGGRTFVETIGGNESNSVRVNSTVELNANGGILNPAASRIFGMIKIVAC